MNRAQKLHKSVGKKHPNCIKCGKPHNGEFNVVPNG